MALNFDSINELNFENVGSWPYPIKVTSCVLVGVALIVAAYFFDTKPQLESLDRYQRKEVQLKKVFETKQRQAASFQAYKTQLEQMRESLGYMLRQLPSRTEVPGLLEDISKAGRTTGLEFELFDPLEEVHHDFYAELPIQIVVDGDYHQFGEFVERIADLRRIVTLHNIEIRQRDKSKATQSDGDGSAKKSNRQLVMKLTAKTYRYAEGENDNAKKKTKKK